MTLLIQSACRGREISRGRHREHAFIGIGRITSTLAAGLLTVESVDASTQVVTAPTNGAAGVVPAVIRYWLDHVPGASTRQIPDFLLTAAAIGGLIKYNASSSGAECGCQAEVGSASAMAAAGLCAVLGGTPMQVENAAEIALEHHLGMTCDPVKGLVQVPCIERCAFGAVKSWTGFMIASNEIPAHRRVDFDTTVEAMALTAREMNSKYKETSEGGLAVSLVLC